MWYTVLGDEDVQIHRRRQKDHISREGEEQRQAGRKAVVRT